MAFFKFRKGGDRQQTAASVHPESVEAMRRRAKHRLIGAAVLVIAGVVGFPLVFDTQPRPIAVDVPIVIPDKNTVKPLAMPAPSVAATTSPATVSGPASSTVAAVVPDKVPANSALSPKEEIVSTPPRAPAATSAAAASTAPATPPAPKPPAVAAASKPSPAPAAAAPVKNSDGAKALALLEGKAPEKTSASTSASASASDSGRFVVQVGAFADADKAREARMKVERSGLKTYTQVADTKDGKRTRVRVGPFASRAEADKAAAKIKGLDLSAAVLTL